MGSIPIESTKFMGICSTCGAKEELPDNVSCGNCIIHLEQMRQDALNHEETDSRNEYVIITREMAIDAGDRRLEGQMWRWG